MAFKIVWSPQAIDDIDAIYSYISNDSQYYAKSVIKKLMKIVNELKKFPYSGRIVPEMNNISIRERFVYSYRVIYKIEADRILILSIIHGKRLIENKKEFKEHLA